MKLHQGDWVYFLSWVLISVLHLMTLSLSTAVWFEKIHAYENSLVIGKIRQLYGGRKKKVIKTKVRKKHHAYKYTKRMSKLWIYYLLVYELWTNSVKTRLWTSGIMWRIRNDDLLNQTHKATSYIQWSASFFGI